ncbi:L-rhamnose isomerase [Oscillospiraceae bacterium HV4-5-C5C]|nr:L-rhamnose isomerase [Oscillospiraceae bacterium HV4-5-C5C]
MNEDLIIKVYESARDQYRDLGVDTDAAISRAVQIPVSMQCWQGDDVLGFDGSDSLNGGIATTGNYPGRAVDFAQLTQDIEKAMSLSPGKLKLNLHASYALKTDPKRDRDAYTIEDFLPWVDWADHLKIGLDFNPTFFSHPRMDGNFTLASADADCRRFWVEHGRRCREIGIGFAQKLGSPCVINYWMPDGYKDQPADTARPRERMLQSLDEIFADKLDERLIPCAIESKLFGIGAESYTVASHEFSYGYALSRHKLYCLDAGHFHPTEVISAKISAVLQYLDQILLHVSRPVRWDSDHVVVYDDELQRTMDEIVFNRYENRVFIGLDFFDASINRVAAWVIGLRNSRKALLNAYLAPLDKLRQAEAAGDFTSRLAWQEERKNLPAQAVWDYLCLQEGAGVGISWLEELKRYERLVQSKRA